MKEKRANGSTKKARAGTSVGAGKTGRSSLPTVEEAARISVSRTAKVLIAGKFVRSESGRTFTRFDADGRFWANVPLCSRKDARDAVVAARAGHEAWEKQLAALRGQIIYRFAEMLEGRRGQFVEELTRMGRSQLEASEHFDQSVDRVLWYAGWADKFSQVVSSSNPVNGPFDSSSAITPIGVVVSVAPAGGGLLGIVEMICAAVVNGNAVVMVVEEEAMSAVTLGEVLSVSDFPVGVVNILTGRRKELVVPLAMHMGVDALDLGDLDDSEPSLAADAAVAATGNLKRTVRTAGQAWDREPSLMRMQALTEMRTVWQTVGQ